MIEFTILIKKIILNILKNLRFKDTNLNILQSIKYVELNTALLI